MPADRDSRPQATAKSDGREPISADDLDSTQLEAIPPAAPEPGKPISADETLRLSETVTVEIPLESERFEWVEPHFLRMEPPERSGEIIRLDPSLREYRVGRLEDSAIRLYTTNASREHARITRCSDGSLVLKPTSFRPIRANGRRVDGELPLEPETYLQFGDDEFVFRGAGTSATARDRRKDRSRDTRFRIAVAVACASLLACAAMLVHVLLL